ncbi:MAG: Uma2 family endonuclease [Lachnospiraceae bacterium]|nr:Uma2 family endonuclease [Lachnospiraceae bacterium]
MLKGGKDGKGYTIADIEALPEGERAELIGGEWFWMDTPVRRHQDILGEMFVSIKLHIRENKGKCKIYAAPFAVYIKKDKFNYVEPDISVVCDREKLDEKGCQGAPDWAIEILSPSSVKMDCERKVKLYREAGVREYWIVDPKAETVTVYDFEHDKEPVRYSFSDRIQAGIFEDLYLKLSEMDI